MEPLEHIRKGAKGVRLTDAERSRMRIELVSYMRAHPIKIRSPFAYLLFTRGAFALSLVILVGGGVTIAAEGSLPGDILYSFKTGVVEPLNGALQISEEAQVAWEVSLADRRLTEADELVLVGIAPGQDEIVAAMVAESATRAAEKVDQFSKVNTERASQVAARFEQSLIAHGGALRGLEGRGSATTTAVLRAAADTVGVGLVAADTRAKGMDVTLMAAFPEMGGAGEPPEVEETPEEKEFTKKYERAKKSFERTRELAQRKRELENKRLELRSR